MLLVWSDTLQVAGSLQRCVPICLDCSCLTQRMGKESRFRYLFPDWETHQNWLAVIFISTKSIFHVKNRYYKSKMKTIGMVFDMDFSCIFNALGCWISCRTLSIWMVSHLKWKGLLLCLIFQEMPLVRRGVVTGSVFHADNLGECDFLYRLWIPYQAQRRTQ